MSIVYKCQKCGGYVIGSFNSVFPPLIGKDEKPCKCKNYPLPKDYKKIVFK